MTAQLMPVPIRMAASLLDPKLAGPEDLRAWNGSDIERRLAVHRNNVLSSLIDALGDTFPVVQELVGEAFFRALCASFVRAKPPQTPVLAQYGAEFPDFVTGFPPAASVPYLADVARLEWMRVLAYHAADAAPVGPEVLEGLFACDGALGDLRITLHPSVCAFRSTFAAVAIWSAHQGIGELAGIDIHAGDCALVLRQGLEVLVLPTTAEAICFVDSLRRGERLDTAIAAATAHAANFDLVALLAALLRRGAVAALGPSGPNNSWSHA